MTMMMKLVPVFAIAALLFAVYLAMKVSRQEAGTKKMKEISDAIFGRSQGVSDGRI